MENSKRTEMIQLFLNNGMSKDILTNDIVLQCISKSVDTMINILIEFKVNLDKLAEKEPRVARILFFTCCQNKNTQYLKHFADFHSDSIENEMRQQ